MSKYTKTDRVLKSSASLSRGYVQQVEEVTARQTNFRRSPTSTKREGVKEGNATVISC